MFLLAFLFDPGASMTVADLRCESVVNPLNVDVARPALSWKVISSKDGDRQTGYEVQVSASRPALANGHGDLWDTGRVRSSATIDIPYAGPSLSSSEEVFWRVRVWDANGSPSSWSGVNRWSMGLIHEGDLKAHWILARPSAGDRASATTYFRKGFVAKPSVKRALCYVSGLGQYEIWINGRRVGNDWITPSWTQYAKTVVADCYDVTSLLQAGKNCVAMHIGNGMYDMSEDKRGGQQLNSLGPRKALCQIEVQYASGVRQVVATDDAWTWAPSPESYSGVFGGEDWDQRLEPAGWKLPSFDDKVWKHATVTTGSGGSLRGLTHASPPLRLIEVRSPVKVTKPRADVLVLNLGQNSPYVPRISVHGAPGTTIRMWPAEVLKEDGTVNQETMRAGKYASYTLDGLSMENWHPAFWYVGSQFWQIEAFDPTGRPIDPSEILTRFEGLLVHAAIKPAGQFRCSNEMFNKIHDLIWWAMCSNFASVISDCPHREKSGWLEEDTLMGPSLMYAFDMNTMFRKVVQDMRDSQQKDGMVPTMAPEYFHYDAGFRDSVEWGGTYLALPEFMRDWYGAQTLVREHYATMKRYVDYLGTRTKDGILSNGLGDWNGYGNDPRTPVAITDTCYYFKFIETLRSFADSLGRKADRAKYASLSQEVKDRFLARFFDRATGKVGSGSQSGQATAIDVGIVDGADVPRAFAQLVADVEQEKFTVSCGEVGHPSLLRVLTKFGRSDLVAKIHLQTEHAGYGYQIHKGLTTLAESWDARPISYNHFMLGHLMEWFYADLVGIRPDPKGSAFSIIDIQPHPVSQVTWANGSYDSVRGRIVCRWRLDGDIFHMDVVIPANTSAFVWVPTDPGAPVRVSFPSSRSLGVFLSKGTIDGYEQIPVSGGRYSFDSSYHLAPH
ncbi:MAG: family 78 glycoside hydrolase catalytic domain [Fimbriimonas sp.]|nr:family 78 glycoside hydrolase catalytic domain [Fimbriimonas sp.]